MNPAPNPTNLADQLTADTYHDLVQTLCLALPPPLTDSPEDLARRDRSAIARIAALAPANVTEADLAALYVAASDQWKECLRLAQAPERSFHGAVKYRTHANAMMRQAQSALRLLLRMQATRQKLEKDSEARDRAAWAEHCALNLMAEALSSQPAPAPITEPPPPASEEPQPQPEPAKQPQPAPLTTAEHEAVIPYPQRFELIHLLGQVPDTFCPIRRNNGSVN